MFYIFQKDKIVSYIITVFTITVLFLTASEFSKKEQTIQTSINEYSINKMENTNYLIRNNIIE